MASPLQKDVYAKPALAWQAVRYIARSLFLQCRHGLFVVANEFVRYTAGVFWAQGLKLWDWYWN
jgi:hypothetical protein